MTTKPYSERVELVFSQSEFSCLFKKPGALHALVSFSTLLSASYFVSASLITKPPSRESVSLDFARFLDFGVCWSLCWYVFHLSISLGLVSAASLAMSFALLPYPLS